MHDAFADDDLTSFAAEGPPPLPEGGATIERDGAKGRLWRCCMAAWAMREISGIRCRLCSREDTA
jgi:hypothetical protein